MNIGDSNTDYAARGAGARVATLGLSFLAVAAEDSRDVNSRSKK